MKKTGTVLALLLGLMLLIVAAATTDQVEAQPVFQDGDDEACITCHTSQETLQELAVEPEDEGEELSEGEG